MVMTNTEENKQYTSRRNFLKNSALATAVGLSGLTALVGCDDTPRRVYSTYEGLNVELLGILNDNILFLRDEKGNHITAYDDDNDGIFNSIEINIKPDSDLEKYACLEKLQKIYEHVKSKRDSVSSEEELKQGEQK